MRDSVLWVGAILFWGLGDTLTTAVGLSSGVTREVGPVSVHVLGIGGVGLLAVFKIVCLFAAFGWWYYWPSGNRVGIPAGLALVGVSITVWNVALITVGVL